MKARGRLQSAVRDVTSGEYALTFVIHKLPSDIPDVAGRDLDITAEPHREKRSLNANALLWKCIGDISAALGADKWDIYLKMLKRYGAYTYVCVKPGAVEMLKRQWRECDEVGPIMVNGQTAVQMLCYYGSSTYDTKQFSVLLDGVISEMEDMGLETPTSERMRRSLEQWEREHEGSKN